METAEGKKPFDIDVAMERIAEAVEPYPKAAMFELAERGYDTPFQQLVACVISIRTRDEESLPISIRLFEAAPTAEDIVALTPDQIDALIRPSTFHEREGASDPRHRHARGRGVRRRAAHATTRCCNRSLGSGRSAPISRSASPAGNR